MLVVTFHFLNFLTFLDLSKSRDDKFLFIESHSQITSEIWFLDAEKPMVQTSDTTAVAKVFRISSNCSWEGPMMSSTAFIIKTTDS